MTTVWDTYTPADVGGSNPLGFVRFRLPYDLRKTDHTVVTDPTDVTLVNGAFTKNMEPGPYEVSKRIPGTRDYLKSYQITVPDSGTVRLADLILSATSWPVPVVQDAQAAAAAAAASRDAAAASAASAGSAVAQAISDLKAGAPAAYDTLIEIANKLDADDGALAALVTAVAGKQPNVAWNSTVQNASFTAAANTGYKVTSGTSFTVTLPATNVAGQQIVVKKIGTDTNTVTLAGTINGNASATVVLRLANEAKVLTADGSGNWNIYAGDLSYTALKTAFDAAYSTFPGSLATVLGDSVDVSQEAPSVKSRNSSWFNYAAILSGQKFTYGYNAGVVGNTTAQMLARFDTDVTPSSPRIVVIGGGENDADPSLSISLATFASNINAIVAKARAIGAAVVLRTTLPCNQTGVRRTNVVKINTWLKANASRLGALAVLDFYSVLVDPSSGGIIAAYDAGDGIHPNDKGNAVLGAYAANVLVPLLPASPPILASTNVDPGNLLTNGLFLGSLSGTPAAQPAGWFVDGASAVAVSLIPGIAGNKLVLDFSGSSANVNVIQQISVTALRGHVLHYSLRISSALTAGTLGSFEVSSDGASPVYVRNAYNMAGSIPDGVTKVSFTVPSDATVVNVAHNVPSGATGRVTLSQASMYDLTALGAI